MLHYQICFLKETLLPHVFMADCLNLNTDTDFPERTSYPEQW